MTIHSHEMIDTPEEWPPGTRFGFCAFCGAQTTQRAMPYARTDATHTTPMCQEWLANPTAMVLLPSEYLMRGRPHEEATAESR